MNKVVQYSVFSIQYSVVVVVMVVVRVKRMRHDTGEIGWEEGKDFEFPNTRDER
jgi:hypothetical protein